MCTRASLLAAALVSAVVVTAAAQPADQAALFNEAATREAALRRELVSAPPTGAAPVEQRIRTFVVALEDLARLYPSSGQADKLVWRGASLSSALFFRFHDPVDRDTALRLLAALKGFTGSVYARQVPALELRLRDTPVATPRHVAPPSPTLPAAPSPRAAAASPANSAPLPTPSTAAPAATAPAPEAPPSPAAASGLAAIPAALTAVRRELLPEAARVTIELNREVTYHSERIQGPDRVFVDLSQTRPVAALRYAVLPFADDVVRRVRVGTQPGGVTRVVLDLEGSARHSVYTLYNPYRIVIDLERPRDNRTARGAGTPPAAALAPAPDVASPASASLTGKPPAVVAAVAVRAEVEAPGAHAPHAADAVAAVVPPVHIDAPTTPPAASPAAAPRSAPDRTVAAAAIVATPPTPAPSPDTPPPATPAINARGGFSLSRQLGLGIARVVIDAGHGGHDPGAQVKGLSEADLTLDVALRLEKLLLRQPGVEVVQTRRTNSYVALEERTEIANRSGADLFLSIHANASADGRARGVETYFLNFAPNAEAEAIAARENAGSARQMRQLPELVRAIALNNKLDESRDLATLVQQSLFTQVRKSDRRARDLGVKQAPFMVLVGASMPSVLTEISFLTNQQDASLLATDKYRQQIAEALLNGIARYQQSLKQGAAVAAQ